MLASSLSAETGTRVRIRSAGNDSSREATTAKMQGNSASSRFEKRNVPSWERGMPAQQKGTAGAKNKATRQRAIRQSAVGRRLWTMAQAQNGADPQQGGGFFSGFMNRIILLSVLYFIFVGNPFKSAAKDPGTGQPLPPHRNLMPEAYDLVRSPSREGIFPAPHRPPQIPFYQLNFAFHT